MGKETPDSYFFISNNEITDHETLRIRALWLVKDSYKQFTVAHPNFHLHKFDADSVFQQETNAVLPVIAVIAADVVAVMLLDKNKAFSSAGNWTLLSCEFCSLVFHNWRGLLTNLVL